ncbi:MAG: NTP transferase domain-containing protein [Candidatus Peregrinibacteria bacterium]|nr:NTP transferase domain-containing protein [Candidatus Peregrinibacteria bacterium]
MKVLILAAGRSKRVKPIEDKNFLRFCGKYLIQHQIEALHQSGMSDIVIIGGAHNLERLQGFAKELGEDRSDLNLAVIEQKDLEAGMAGAVMSAYEATQPEDSILIVSSNDVMDAEAYRLVFDASQNDAYDSYILGKRVTEYFPGGYLEVDENAQIKSIIEKPGEGNEPSDLVNLVLHFHRDPKRLYEALQKTETSNDDRYEVALDQMIQSGVKMQAIGYSGYWQPIKFPWDILEVAKYYYDVTPNQIASSATVNERANIVGEVIIGEGAKVFAGATIVGPAYIGANTVVATNALVRDSYLGENCVVGYNTEIARSFLSDDVWTHSNYIGDSIVGDNVSFGAGTITGNLRFDEGNIQVTIEDDRVDSGQNKLGIITGNNIRVGINTNFMPGIKIGSETLIGAGINIAQDIPENSYVEGEPSSQIKISQNRANPLPSREEMRKKL